MAETCSKDCKSKKRLSQETASKLADKTRKQRKEEDLDGRDEALNALRAPRRARRAQELTEARKEAGERLREEAERKLTR